MDIVTGFICLFLIFYQHFTVHCILLSFCLKKEKQRPCKSLGSEGAPWKWTVLCAWKLLGGKPFLPLHIAKQSRGDLIADCILLDVRRETRMAPLTLMWAFSNKAELPCAPVTPPPIQAHLCLLRDFEICRLHTHKNSSAVSFWWGAAGLWPGLTPECDTPGGKGPPFQKCCSGYV